MNVKIETPWGKLDSDNPMWPIATIFIGLKQLREYKRNGKGNPLTIDDDIKGYEELLETNSKDVCRNFLRLKEESRVSGKRFANNMEVIKHMKGRGLWKEVT